MLFGLVKRKNRTLRLKRAKLPQVKIICPRCFNHTTWTLPTGCHIEMSAPFTFHCSCGERTDIGVPYVEERERAQTV